MTAPDLTEARDLAAMWKARAEAAEAIAAKLARDVWAAIGFRDDPTIDRDLDDACGFVGQQARMRFDDLAIGRDNHHTRASIAEAIIRGRSDAPTPEEIAALHAVDGSWLVRFVGSEGPTAERLVDRYGATVIARDQRAGWYQRGVRWWARNASGDFVAWPVAP